MRLYVKGAKLLFDATRRNSSVLYVTQKQNGFMIEGHREIAGRYDVFRNTFTDL